LGAAPPQSSWSWGKLQALAAAHLQESVLLELADHWGRLEHLLAVSVQQKAVLPLQAA